ncbi:hypothetical protein KA057_03720 [Candidatus Gracilibacteria bacterium]|nr:hypothetical protein [Candidatus Gracilibacteria bacterium]
MSETVAESNKPRKALPETSLQLFEQKIRTLPPKDLQAEWIKFLKERGFDSIYTQPGKELSVGFASSLVYHGTYGYSEEALEKAPTELKALYDFFMSPKIKPETRNKLEMFGAEIIRRNISRETKEKIGGMDKLASLKAYNGLGPASKQFIKLLPGGPHYKMRLAIHFAQFFKDLENRDTSASLKTLYEIESIFIKTNKDYNKKSNKDVSYRKLTEAFILGSKHKIIGFSSDKTESEIIKAGYFFNWGDETRILKRIDKTEILKLNKNNRLYRLFDGVVDIPDAYTIHYFSEDKSISSGLHFSSVDEIFINTFGFWKGPEKTTFPNEIFHSIVTQKMRSDDWDRIDLSGVFDILGWKKDSNFPAQEIEEFLSDVASINEDISGFYEYFQDDDNNGRTKSWSYKNYNLAHMQFLVIVKEVLGEKRNQEIRDTFIGKSNKKVRLSKEEEKKVQEYYLNLGRAVLMEIKTQIKKLPPSVPPNTDTISE